MTEMSFNFIRISSELRDSAVEILALSFQNYPVWLCERSLTHPTSVGVGLDTETPTNVAIYQRCGFQVTATTQVEDIPIWCMFRQTSGT